VRTALNVEKGIALLQGAMASGDLLLAEDNADGTE
jgi:hypothetical protein